MSKFIKEWKKVLESDLHYIVNELREEIQTPAVILLEGELGAGKTTLAQYIAGKNLLSPTYSILSECQSVVHADFYRLESAEELIHLELPLYLEQKDYFIAEWGERWIDQLATLVPDHFNYYLIRIETHEGKNTRDYRLSSINPLLP
jgi:tRNA threonylcarbamoyladenosine biosynthesis protein TsaE